MNGCGILRRGTPRPSSEARLASKPTSRATANPTSWAAALCRRRADWSSIDLTGAVANRVAAAFDLPPLTRAPLLEGASPLGTEFEIDDPPFGWGDPWLVGLVHEQSASSADRKARGAWFTPRQLVEGLVLLATADGAAPPSIIDPTCGGGAFLLAALDRLVELGVDPDSAVERVVGIDIDAHSVEVTRWSITLWLARERRRLGRLPFIFEPSMVNVRRDDALRMVAADELGSPDEPFGPPGSLVIGNPPFASPLKSGTVPPEAAHYREARAELLGPYADIGAAHLLRAVERASDGSTVAFVQPQSILASRDTEALRSHLDEAAPLQAMWAAREAVFDAGVRACAPVLLVGGRRATSVRLASGPAVEQRGSRSAKRWSELAAAALGAPDLPPMTGRLDELVTGATAGFRDEHYGLVSVCREAEPGEEGGNGVTTARLVTVGSIDPLTVAWGVRPFRFGGKDWTRPMVDRSGLPPKVAGWFDRRLGPKVLLATQSRLLEPIVDRAGDLMPATPLVAVDAEPEDLDRVAAVFLAPPVVAWAWCRWFGAALSVDALKLAARQVGDLPLPVDRSAWDEAAAIVASADGADEAAAFAASCEVAVIMTGAYQASGEVLDWWLARAGRGSSSSGRGSRSADAGALGSSK